MDSSSSSSSSSKVSQAGGRNSASMTPTVVGRRQERGSPVTESRCQVEGCSADLSGGKLYHVRHRVCVDHSKSPAVVVAGRRQRFCQQCSRFHDLGEFDDEKRSCRRRLAGHNLRRRKPTPILPTLIHYPVQFTGPSSYGGQFTTVLGMDMPLSHFNASKPIRTDGYDSFISGFSSTSPGLSSFNSNPQMPSLHPDSSVVYGRCPYGYHMEPFRQRLTLENGYTDDGSDARNLFGGTASETVLSVFCQRDDTVSHSAMLHPLTKHH